MSESGGSFGGAAKNRLTEKVAGVPLYIYGIGFVAAFWLWKKYQAAKTPPVISPQLNNPPSVSGLGTPRSGSTAVPIVPSSGALTNGTGFNPGPGLPQPQLVPSDWINQGVAYLAAQGYDATKAQQALSSYTTGTVPTGDAARYVNLVVSRLGSPAAPLSGSGRIVGFVRPAGFAGTFAQYDDGSLIFLGDATQTSQALQSASQAGVSTDVVDIPANDPRWNNADVVKNQDLHYLWGELWANYVEPSRYYGRLDTSIIKNPATIAAAQALWQKSLNGPLNGVPGGWNEGNAPANHDDLAQQAYFTAFPPASSV